MIFFTRPTTQKMKFSIKDFFSKCDQIRSFMRIWSHLLKESLMENLIFCVVTLKPWENLCFSVVFKSYRKRPVARNGLEIVSPIMVQKKSAKII